MKGIKLCYANFKKDYASWNPEDRAIRRLFSKFDVNFDEAENGEDVEAFKRMSPVYQNQTRRNGKHCFQIRNKHRPTLIPRNYAKSLKPQGIGGYDATLKGKTRQLSRATSTREK